MFLCITYWFTWFLVNEMFLYVNYWFTWCFLLFSYDSIGFTQRNLTLGHLFVYPTLYLQYDASLYHRMVHLVSHQEDVSLYNSILYLVLCQINPSLRFKSFTYFLVKWSFLYWTNCLLSFSLIGRECNLVKWNGSILSFLSLLFKVL